MQQNILNVKKYLLSQFEIIVCLPFVLSFTES